MSNSRKTNISPPKFTKKPSTLTKRPEFLRLQRRGLRISSVFLTAYVLRAPKGTSGKLGLTVSKKVGNAPARNLIKRRLRHLARENPKLWAGILVSLIAKPKSADAPFSALKSDFRRLFNIYHSKLRGQK